MISLRVRTIFFAHTAVAIYCLTCGIFDGRGPLPPWMMPNVVALFALAVSALLFPFIAGLSLIGSTIPHPIRILAAHVGISVIQTYFGLLPLVS